MKVEVFMNKFANIMRKSYIARFFIPAGLILIIAVVIFLISCIKNQNYIKVEAIVTPVYNRYKIIKDKLKKDW